MKVLFEILRFISLYQRDISPINLSWRKWIESHAYVFHILVYESEISVTLHPDRSRVLKIDPVTVFFFYIQLWWLIFMQVAQIQLMNWCILHSSSCVCVNLNRRTTIFRKYIFIFIDYFWRICINILLTKNLSCTVF